MTANASREEILGRLRSALGGDRHARRRAADAHLAVPSRGPQPRLEGSALTERFAAMARTQASTVEQVAGLAAAPAAAARHLAAAGLPPAAAVAPELAALDWAGAGIEATLRAAVDSDRTGITGCFCAIAETGTLMLLSAPDSPASLSLLPETHIALVACERIVATMEDAFDLLRAERGGLPRAVNFVSGPSRTGDIEQTLVIGAHGPCRVHIILAG